MAEDESLDSFFAKKDKGKKKSDKKTRITTDDINQMMEKSLKPKSARKSEKKLEQQEKKSSKNTKEEDDEWEIFDEEEERKAIELKVQNLYLSSKSTTESCVGDGVNQVDTNSENIDKDSLQSPWKPITIVKKEEEEEKVEVVEKPEPVKPAEVKPQKYIPPAARNQVYQSNAKSKEKYEIVGGRRRRVLDVNSADDFPQLGK